MSNTPNPTPETGFTAADLRDAGAPEDIVGHGTKADGSHVPLTRAAAVVILEAAEVRKAKREADMPTERDAINVMFEAWQRLKELGWNEAIYCPKDGSSFDVIEPGSTGIFRAHYTGKWPTGSWWLEDHGDLWPSQPILFRLDPEAEAARKARMDEARRRYVAERDADRQHQAASRARKKGAAP